MDINELFTAPVPYVVLPDDMSRAEKTELVLRPREVDGLPVLLLVGELLRSAVNCEPDSDNGLSLDEFISTLLDEYGGDMADIMGSPMDEAPKSRNELTVMDISKDFEAVACFPVKRPEELFRFFPYGGCNECPSPRLLALFVKELNERYGALPIAFCYDSMELYVPARPADTDEAVEIAKRIYALCPDAVLQGAGTLYALAKHLMQSPIWLLRWD